LTTHRKNNWELNFPEMFECAEAKEKLENLTKQEK